MSYWSENQHLDSRTNSFEQLALALAEWEGRDGHSHFLPRTVRVVGQHCLLAERPRAADKYIVRKGNSSWVQFLLVLNNTAGNSRVYLYKSLLGERTATSNRYTSIPLFLFLKNS